MTIQDNILALEAKTGLAVQLLDGPNDNKCLVIKDYHLNEVIWNKKTTDILLLIPPLYPNAKLDMFWVDQDLLYSDNSVPQSADVIETYLGGNWRRFSRHITDWNPARDSLISFMDNIDLWLSNKSII